MLFLDDLIFSLQSVGGISVYWLEILKKFNQDSHQNITLLKQNRRESIVYNPSFWKKSIKNEVSLPIELLRLFPLLNKLPPFSIFHSSYLRLSWQKNICNIITIHDLAGELRMTTGWKRHLKIMLQALAIKKADGIICVSNSTRDRLLNYYSNVNPDKVKTIYHGCSDQFFQMKNDRSFKEQKIILFIGSRSNYKNFTICMESLSSLTDFHLQIIGGGKLTLKEILLLDSKLSKRYSFIKEVTTKELNLIYNNAFCLLYPTLYEGFGMPVIEAMKCGCPVISSNITAIKEVSGDAALLINNPKDAAEFIQSINSLTNYETRNDFIKRGIERSKKFNWDDHFLETKKFYNYIFYNKFKKELFSDS
jgi:glycosyltransferase involved in cell wall biosynthesis